MKKEEDDQKNIKQIGAFVTIPFVLAVPPILGWLIGSWLDKEFGTAPFLMLILIIFGFAAGIFELYRLIKRFGNGD